MLVGKKRLSKNEHYQGSSWKIAFSGFILIMLCFFVLMNSFATFEEDRTRKVVESFREAINATDNINEIVNFDSKEKLKNIYGNKNNNEKMEDVSQLERKNNFEKTEVNYNELNGKCNKIAMKVETPIFFEDDSHKISATSLPLLKKIGNTIKSNSYTVQILGYDNGESDSFFDDYLSWEISIKRAVSVFRYLTEEMNVPEENILAEGFGKYKFHNNKQKYEKNKSNNIVEIILYKKIKNKMR